MTVNLWSAVLNIEVELFFDTFRLSKVAIHFHSLELLEDRTSQWGS